MKKPLIQAHAGQRDHAARSRLVKAERGVGDFLHSLWPGKYLYSPFWLPQNIWVNFKVFGLTALTLVFTVLSGVYIYRHMPQDENK
ncbi:Probable intracellular septation protein A [Kluyvera cryocrescens]|uniref:Probable intracellular septation protein A n=1 Tax=Kluyvera cryocrescens TaxID=580 RepID=A0A485A5P8_KLUCR|nr:Probable intracellular septation protein A [Kluyvera cryocrescens]